MLGKAPRDILLEILQNHKLNSFTTDKYDDASIPACICGHMLADESIEEHQTQLITVAFLDFIKP